MSYILDALKKAERERGIAKVPTLSSVHELRTKPPIRLWAASGILLLCIVVFFGLYFFVLNTHRSETIPSAAVETGKAVVHSAQEPLIQQTPADKMPPFTPAPVTSPSAGAGNPPEIPASADEAGKEPVDDTGHAPSEARNQMVPSSRVAEISRPRDFAPGNPPRGPTGKPPSPPGTSATGAEESNPAVEVAGEKHATLREAMNEMTMSILFYSKNKAERLVFINGRKYVEGDTIDGRYLLESITPEGAVLSFEGEKAILRPERN